MVRGYKTESAFGISIKKKRPFHAYAILLLFEGSSSVSDARSLPSSASDIIDLLLAHNIIVDLAQFTFLFCTFVLWAIFDS